MVRVPEYKHLYTGLAQLERASPLQGEGRRFDPVILYQLYTLIAQRNRARGYEPRSVGSSNLSERAIKKLKGEITMNRTAAYYKMRVEMLVKREPSTNRRIIAKLIRKVRQLEKIES